MTDILKGKIGTRVAGPNHDPEKVRPIIFVTSPFKNPKNNDELSVIIIPFSSIKENEPHDPTCEITTKEAEHELIRMDSWLYYGMASIVPLKKILENKNNEYNIENAVSLKKETLQRIYAGISRSPATPQRVKIAYEFSQSLGKDQQETYRKTTIEIAFDKAVEANLQQQIKNEQKQLLPKTGSFSLPPKMKEKSSKSSPGITNITNNR